MKLDLSIPSIEDQVELVVCTICMTPKLGAGKVRSTDNMQEERRGTPLENSPRGGELAHVPFSHDVVSDRR